MWALEVGATAGIYCLLHLLQLLYGFLKETVVTADVERIFILGAKRVHEFGLPTWRGIVHGIILSKYILCVGSRIDLHQFPNVVADDAFNLCVHLLL